MARLICQETGKSWPDKFMPGMRRNLAKKSEYQKHGTRYNVVEFMRTLI